MNKISGVYKITNTITGDFYIGSSKNIKHRWYNHRAPSSQARNPNLRMYQDMTQFGLNNFTLEVLEETDNLKVREQYWIEQLNPSYNRNRANGWDFERCKESKRKWARKNMKRYNNQLCLYNGETITLNSLSKMFYRQGIPHPTLEAKKYLIKGE